MTKGEGELQILTDKDFETNLNLQETLRKMTLAGGNLRVTDAP